MLLHELLPLADVLHTHEQLLPFIRHTPLLQANNLENNQRRLYFKCENLQISYSFKIRGALSCLLNYQKQADVWQHIQKHGVITCSSGNFAQGLAYATNLLDIECTVIVHESIKSEKLRQIQHNNPKVNIITIPKTKWFKIMVEGSYPDNPAYFISCETDYYATLGNATIALELLRDLPTADSILVPYGGGNLALSIALYAKQINPHIKVYAVEIATGAALKASLQAQSPVEVPYQPSFIDAIGGNCVIPSQFYKLQQIIEGSLIVDVSETATAVTYLAQYNKLIVEGAGAVAVAAYHKYQADFDWANTCCILSGGSIGLNELVTLLQGHIPNSQ